MTTLSRRTFAGAGAAAFAAAAGGLSVGALARSGPKSGESLAYVHPELRAAARAALARTTPPLSSSTLGDWRRRISASAPPLLEKPRFEQRSIPGRTGRPDVGVVVINRSPGARKPGVLHTHGGGYVFGGAQTDIGLLQVVASELDCVIVTVDYRLAPETNFSGSIEDNYAGLVWLHQHAAELGVDRARIAVMGESAGGGHAALLALTARDRGEVPLIFQTLIYPMLDDRTGSTIHPRAPAGSIVWSGDFNRFGWRSFLGMEPGTARVPARAVPARWTDLSGLPPTFIGVGSIDLFADEDIHFARRLIDAGVSTELVVVPGAFHGFDRQVAGSDVVTRFNDAKLNAMRLAFASPKAEGIRA